MQQKYLDKFLLVKPPTLRREPVCEEVESKGEPTGLASDIVGPLGGLQMKRGKELSLAAGLPPPIQITPKLNHAFRFLASSGGTFTVNTANVIGALGVVCYATNGNCRPFSSSFRIRKVTIWTSAGTSTAFNASVVWTLATGNQMKDDEVETSVPEGISVTRSLVSSPPKGSLAAMWQVSSSNTLFTVQCNAGSILDLDVDYTISNQFVSGSQAVATGVLGNIYYFYLDGNTSHTLVPVGLPSTF
jgi:hypothetical protein